MERAFGSVHDLHNLLISPLMIESRRKCPMQLILKMIVALVGL